MRIVEPETLEGRIRLAHAGDVPGLVRVQIASWHASYADIIPVEELRKTSYRPSTERFRHTLVARSRRSAIHVIEDARGIYGYSTIGHQRVRALPFRGEVFELYVHPDRWGEGAGRRLLTNAIWTLVDQRLNPVMLWVLTENVRARRFYEHCGARPIARAPIQLGDKVTTKLAYGWDRMLPLPLS